MTARELLAEVARHGGRLTPRGDKLHIDAPEPLPDDLMDRLRAHKPELLKLLAGEGQLLHTNLGKGYRHPDGRAETGQPEPMPRPVTAWPDDLTAVLNRVATHFEWSQTDVREFCQWARRSNGDLSDARAFLEAELSKLPAPGLSDRRRVVIDILKKYPSLRYAYTVDDDRADPVRLVLAVRNVGTCELAIPRAKFDALELPLLIDRLTNPPPATGDLT